ncbi:MAG: NAD(P)H-dependent oxidoreductase [Myxococcota bacterium]
MKVLRIDASARRGGSRSRAWADALLDELGPTEVVHRDLGAEALPQLDEATLRHFGYLPDDAGPTATSALSERLIGELEAADAIVIATPIYNFSVPAALKAWIDLVARSRRTFRYTSDGPRGLLADRPVYVVVASGGTRIGSDADFATPYLVHVLGFLGLRDVRVIDTRGAARGEDGVRDAVRRALRKSAAAA